MKQDKIKEELSQIKAERDAILKIQDIQEHVIMEVDKTTSEATAFIVLSDFHCEEIVKKSTVNGLNEYNLRVANSRINQVFQNALTVYNVLRKDICIPHIVVALLGDFISGNIHEELLENTSLRPVEALMWVQNRLYAGLRYLIGNVDADITIVCCSGNHSRITDKTHFSTFAGNSLEFFMYNNLKEKLQCKNVTWIVQDSYHTYLKVYKYVVRFHHGDGIKYFGGVSGIFLPAYKSISQWDKARHADLDVFAHFHQQKDGGNFVCNGSLIGYNAYAIRIKADFEQPKQLFFLLDKKHGKTMTTQIYID